RARAGLHHVHTRLGRLLAAARPIARRKGSFILGARGRFLTKQRGDAVPFFENLFVIRLGSFQLALGLLFFLDAPAILGAVPACFGRLHRGFGSVLLLLTRAVHGALPFGDGRVIFGLDLHALILELGGLEGNQWLAR